MEFVQGWFKFTLTDYLRKVPIPKSIADHWKLSAEDWMNLAPLYFFLAFFFYTCIQTMKQRRKKTPKPKVNYSLMKEDPKVVTQMDIEDLGDKIAFCRCWRSKKFPLCDGSHNQHNAEARDNVGPLLLRRDEK